MEPAKKAAQVLHKKLQGCMQSQPGLEAERRMVLRYKDYYSVSTSPVETFDWLLTGVASAPLSTEKAPSDAALSQHGREPQRL